MVTRINVLESCFVPEEPNAVVNHDSSSINHSLVFRAPSPVAYIKSGVDISKVHGVIDYVFEPCPNSPRETAMKEYIFSGFHLAETKATHGMGAISFLKARVSRHFMVEQSPNHKRAGKRDRRIQYKLRSGLGLVSGAQKA